MTEQEFTTKANAGEVKAVEQPKTETQSAPPPPQNIEDFLPYLMKLRYNIKSVSTAPTFKPRGFLEHFVTYDTGGVRRLYIYVNGSWRYTTLT